MARMTECRACRGRVAASADRCPSCGQNKPGSRPGLVLLIVLVIVVLFLLFGHTS